MVCMVALRDRKGWSKGIASGSLTVVYVFVTTKPRALSSYTRILVAQHRIVVVIPRPLLSIRAKLLPQCLAPHTRHTALAAAVLGPPGLGARRHISHMQGRERWRRDWPVRLRREERCDRPPAPVTGGCVHGEHWFDATWHMRWYLPRRVWHIARSASKNGKHEQGVWVYDGRASKRTWGGSLLHKVRAPCTTRRVLSANMSSRFT